MYGPISGCNVTCLVLLMITGKLGLWQWGGPTVPSFAKIGQAFKS